MDWETVETSQSRGQEGGGGDLREDPRAEEIRRAWCGEAELRSDPEPCGYLESLVGRLDSWDEAGVSLRNWR